MKTVSATVRTRTVAPPREQPPSVVTMRGGEDEQRSSEAFEAIIIRLDGPTAERLFRLAGE